MCRRAGLTLKLIVCILFGQYAQVTNANVLLDQHKKPAMKVVLGALRVTSRGIDLRYHLRNDSRQDIWICDDVTTVNYDLDFEVLLSDKAQTLTVRKRLDIPTKYCTVPVIGRYIRLPAGQTRTELLSLDLPVHSLPLFASLKEEPTYRLHYAKNLVLEIGYYTRDLLGLVRGILEEADKNSDPDPEKLVTIGQTGIELQYQTVWLTKISNKDLSDSSEKLSIPYSFQRLKGERLARVAIKGMHIPFNELQAPDPWDAPKYLTRRTPVEVLQDLFYEGEIEIEEYRGAEIILNCEDYLYNKTARRIADVYKRVARGDHHPGELSLLLDKIADKNERGKVFAELRKKRAEEEQQKPIRIGELYQQAKNYKNMGNDRKALAVLDELFALAPSHEDALHLRQQISHRYLGEVKTNSIGMKLAWIPPGDFLMGTPSDEGGRANERPVHKVRISRGFWMLMYEVTQRQYRAIMGRNPSHFKGDDFPVEMVSWDDAIKFCHKLGQKEGTKYRLPTEAEWEYASRAGTTTLYSWGDTQHLGLCNAENSTVEFASGKVFDRNVAVFKERGLPVDSTVPVGSFKANTFGLYDMHGNVREWCQDSSNWDYYRRSPQFQLDPQGLGHGLTRQIRGGSWRKGLSDSRSAYREDGEPSERVNDLGFRVVLEGTIP